MSSMMSPGMHPVLGALRDIDAGLDELAEGNLWSLLDSESLQVRVELERLGARLYAQRLRATREVEVRGAPVAAGATSSRSWLINVLRIHPGEAAREVALAAALDQDLPVTAAALSAGEIGPAAVAVIAESDAALRKVATAAERADAEATLADCARTLPVRGLQTVALHLQHRLDPDQGERLAKEEQAQVARREIRFRNNPDGSCRPDGYLDKEATALLRAALDPLAKPRPAADGTPDPRTPPQRMGDALIELVELALRSGDLPTQAGQPVQLVVTIGLSDLESRLAGAVGRTGTTAPRESSSGAGRFHRPDPFHNTGTRAGAGVGVLDTGIPVSADTVRRWACDCQVIPMVLGSHGEPLDVGRASRTATPAIRRALDVRDRGCAFPGCDRPPKWTVVHHIWHWQDGGPTSAGNCVLLCGHHHRTVHHHGWDVRIETDGLPSFYPPAWIDPDRQPQRNHRHRPHPPSSGGHPCGRPGSGGAPILPFDLTRIRS
jgi:Domain of unknown function (DUF222)/HNH endonuclease